MFEAFILGLVQGLGEFLPISSSGHLVVVPWLFGFPDPGLGFDVALHWATLLSVLVYFRNDIMLLVRGFWHSLWPSTRNISGNIYQKLPWLLLIASVPGAIIGKLLEEQAESTFRNPLLVAGTMLGFGLVLFFIDKWSKKMENLDQITKGQAVLVGLSQAFAIIPGVSRSGATMAAGLALGFKRADSARFSFLLSIPIILGAGLVKIGEFGQGVSIPELLVGFVTAGVSGFLAIKYLLRFIANHNFNIFVWYRIGFAMLVALVYIFRG